MALGPSKKVLRRKRMSIARDVATKKGKQAEISSGIEKLTNDYKSTGKLKTSRATYHPKSTKNAQQIAAAIEYGKHGEVKS